jgi:hypothetical protein
LQALGWFVSKTEAGMSFVINKNAALFRNFLGALWSGCPEVVWIPTDFLANRHFDHTASLFLYSF